MAVPAADRLIANRYALRRSLGRGEMGRVWHAQDTLLGREVAVKQVVILPLLAAAERRVALAWVMREARAIARLDHPGMVPLLDVVEDHGEIFLVTELVQAPTLADLVRARGPLAPLRVAEIGAEVVSALEAAHRAGIVHRDVKPANVLVQPDGGVRLAGFGVTSLQGLPHFTAAALAVSSPSYLAPEQARGHPSGPATDMWALGATMFFAVEGEPPFDKGTLIRTLAAVVKEDPRPMRRAGPLKALLTALLAKNPEDRLAAQKVRVWLRWLVDVARPAPPSEVLPAEGPGGSDLSPATSPASEPAKARRWRSGVLALLVVGGLLVAWLAGPVRMDRAGEERAAPAATRRGAAVTGTTQPAWSTAREPATTRPTATRTTTTTSTTQSGLPARWRPFINRAGSNRVGVPSGFQVRTRQRYNATVVEEQGGARRVFTVRSQNPSAPLPQASRDYRAWARRNFAGFHEVRYAENQRYAGRGPAVVFEYEAVRDGRRVHVRHINVKGRTWGYNVEFIAPAEQWDASQQLARQLERAFQPLG
jgi:eukaryotic-like serine/threonine-protein kinase